MRPELVEVKYAQQCHHAGVSTVVPSPNSQHGGKQTFLAFNNTLKTQRIIW